MVIDFVDKVSEFSVFALLPECGFLAHRELKKLSSGVHHQVRPQVSQQVDGEGVW